MVLCSLIASSFAAVSPIQSSHENYNFYALPWTVIPLLATYMTFIFLFLPTSVDFARKKYGKMVSTTLSLSFPHDFSVEQAFREKLLKARLERVLLARKSFISVIEG